MTNKETYIKDLYEDNNKLFAMNHKINETRKEMKQELIKLCDGKGNDNDIKLCASLIGRLMGLAYLYRLNLKDIKSNLEKIRGLRNGTIEEI